MSWRVTKLVREARLAGLYKDVQPTEFSVLFFIADACRNDSVVASISMSELETLTGLSRTTMSRAVRALIAKECIRRTEYGSQGQASKYALLQPESRSANATYSRGADATWWEDDHVADHVANATDHVANAADHVAPTQRPRSAHATNPETEITIPSTNPESRAARARARESDPVNRAEEIVSEWVEGCNRKGGARRLLHAFVADALRAGLDEDRVIDVITRWQPTGAHNRLYATASPYVLKKMLDALAKEGL